MIKLLGDWSGNIKMLNGFFVQNLLVENAKSEHQHWILHLQISLGILHIQINLGTKFQLELKILIFRTKFAHKGYLWSKTEFQ